MPSVHLNLGLPPFNFTNIICFSDSRDFHYLILLCHVTNSLHLMTALKRFGVSPKSKFMQNTPICPFSCLIDKNIIYHDIHENISLISDEKWNKENIQASMSHCLNLDIFHYIPSVGFCLNASLCCVSRWFPFLPYLPGEMIVPATLPVRCVSFFYCRLSRHMLLINVGLCDLSLSRLSLSISYVS